jgi:hypothetical protein
MNKQIPSELIDELMELYVEWREACVAVEHAYARWSTVRLFERESAFAEYRATLDWEELTSAVYQNHLPGRAKLAQ